MGKISPRLDWYVTDDRPPLRDPGQQPQAALLAQATFAERTSAAVKEARLNGIRPMPIARLLDYLRQDANAKASARIRQKLDMKAPADFPRVASLETILKTIKKTTTDDNYPGIPIYVDPIGISEVKVTMAAEIDVYGDQPIRKMLSDCLRRLGLMYDVRDGFLMISSRTTILEHRVEDIDQKLDRVIEMLGRLEHKN